MRVTMSRTRVSIPGPNASQAAFVPPQSTEDFRRDVLEGFFKLDFAPLLISYLEVHISQQGALLLSDTDWLIVTL